MNDTGKSGGSEAPVTTGERPTLKTIAYMTGLGITTVSRALKDAPDIGAETKERVRLIARQIGYQPNRAGVKHLSIPRPLHWHRLGGRSISPALGKFLEIVRRPKGKG